MSDRIITAADVSNNECPLHCHHLGGYDEEVRGSWYCKFLKRSLIDNYDCGASGGPNIPYKGDKCPLFAEFHAQPLQCIRELMAHFDGHDPKACVLGNVLAGDAAAAMRFALKELLHE